MCTPSYFAKNVPERSPEDQVPEMNITSYMEEKSKINAEVKGAEDMDSGARASYSFVQIQEDHRAPESNESERGQLVCVANVPDETVKESAVAQNESIDKQNKKDMEEPWVKKKTRAAEVPERPLNQNVNEAHAPYQFITTYDQLNPSTSHSSQAYKETLEKLELPGTTKNYQDPRNPIPSTGVEMTSTRRGDQSSSSEQESETVLELESGDVRSCLFTIPVEEKGIASFLDSCQEASALDFEVISLNETDRARFEHQEETHLTGENTMPNRMRLRNKRGQDCSVS